MTKVLLRTPSDQLCFVCARKVDCVGTRSDPLNNCFAVDGGARIYFESEAICSDASNRSKMEVKTAMDSGAFNQLDDRILKPNIICREL